MATELTELARACAAAELALTYLRDARRAALLAALEAGDDSQSEIARRYGVTRGYVAQLATAAAREHDCGA